MGEVLRSLREAAHSFPEGSRPWLVSFERGLGIVKCSHTEKEAVIQLLLSVQRVGTREVRVRTLGTSGTIRGAREKYVESE